MLLGALLIAVLMIAYACSSAGGPDSTTQVSASTTASAGPAGSAAPTANPSDEVIAPIGEVTPSPTPSPTASAANSELCTDNEIRVTARPERTTMPRGATLSISLLVKNVSNRTCSRDVGADLQELRILQGTEKIWSSDDCGGLRGHELRQFPPGHERSYSVVWNGKSSSACAKTIKRTPDGPTPRAGEYQLYGRVGTHLSSPVTLTLK
jgi:hypothetical protein